MDIPRVWCEWNFIFLYVSVQWFQFHIWKRLFSELLLRNFQRPIYHMYLKLNSSVLSFCSVNAESLVEWFQQHRKKYCIQALQIHELFRSTFSALLVNCTGACGLERSGCYFDLDYTGLIDNILMWLSLNYWQIYFPFI